MINRRTFLKYSTIGPTLFALSTSISISSDKNASTQEYLRKLCMGIPKAELHVHFSAMIYPDVALDLAKKNNLGKLSFSDPAEVPRLYLGKGCQAPCIESSEDGWKLLFTLLDELMGTIRTPEDIWIVINSWIKRSAIPSNIKYAELTVPHPVFHKAAISLEDYMSGLTIASQKAEAEYGIKLRYIGSLFLYDSVQAGIDALHDFAPYKDKTPLIGVTGYNETYTDLTQIAPVYKLARELGFRRPIHVGKGAPNAVQRMWDAITKTQYRTY